MVTLNGRDTYLGPFGTKASRLVYDRLNGEWLAGGRQPLSADSGGLTIVELMAHYLAFVKGYYQPPSKEPGCIALALKPLRSLYGGQPASEFGPVALKDVRQTWIDAGLCRSHINQRTGLVKRMFKRGVAEELVPAHVWHALQSVDG